MNKTSMPFEMFIRKTLCRIGGHPDSGNHRTVMIPKIMEFLDQFAANPNTKTAISGKCTFCDAVLWEMWPSAVKYLQEKEES
jgi:hypothetical protein